MGEHGASLQRHAEGCYVLAPTRIPSVNIQRMCAIPHRRTRPRRPHSQWESARSESLGLKGQRAAAAALAATRTMPSLPTNTPTPSRMLHVMHPALNQSCKLPMPRWSRLPQIFGSATTSPLSGSARPSSPSRAAASRSTDHDQNGQTLIARADVARTVAAHLRRHCESFAPPLASSAGSRWQTSRVT
jgi:hypothetical protein